MTSVPSHTRRGFLGALGMLAGAPTIAAAHENRARPRLAATAAAGLHESQAEYGLAPGLTYLNTASLGPAPRDVLDRTVEAWRQIESNPVRMAYGGGTVHTATDQVRETAAKFLSCGTDDVLITRSTTEAMNTVALGMRLSSGDRVLTTDQEHHGGIDCWTYLGRRRGIVVDRVAISHADQDARTIVDRFARAITANTRVISVSQILSSTGVRMPVAEIAALSRARGILCVVDGAQAVGQIAVNVKELGCHAYAACGHKWLMGPKGTGLLYVSPDATEMIAPVQWEGGKRYVGGSTGMGSLPLVLGLGAAIEKANGQGIATIERRVLALREYAIRQLTKTPKITVVNAPSGPLASGLVALVLPGTINSQGLQTTLLDKHNIMVKLVEKQWFNGIRISAHIFNTEADIDRAVQALRTELG